MRIVRFDFAGTGKTECVKSLGALLGRLVLVFNCSEVSFLQIYKLYTFPTHRLREVDFLFFPVFLFSFFISLKNVDVTAISLILAGLARCGAFGCFDEFNRLQEATLSVLSMIIQPIQTAIQQKSDAVTIFDEKVDKTFCLNGKLLLKSENRLCYRFR